MLALRSPLPLILLAAVSVAAAPALAQRLKTTGSRLGDTIADRMIMRFSTPGEIDEIYELLERGETEEALALAEAFLASLDTTVHTGGSSAIQERYLALNAWCVALTNAARYADAVTACTDATSLMPGRWAAHNNLGTARLSLGQSDAALADYRHALELAPNEDVRRLIVSNIRLAESDD